MKNLLHPQTPGPVGALAGLVVGLCATQALDWVSIWLYERERPSRRRAENRARRGQHAYEVATDRLARGLGYRMRPRSIARWGWRFHKSFGLLGGWLYLRLRRAYPRLAWGQGLAFGTAFFVVVDELLVPALRLTPGPRAFSWRVHARGAASHLAYGIAAESAARLLAPPAISARTAAT